MKETEDFAYQKLPFQKSSDEQSTQQNYDDVMDDKQVDFSTAFIEGAKTTARRLLFHFKALASAITLQICKFFIPSSIDPFYGATFLCSYIGVVMLFPLQKNHLATGLGLLTALLVTLAGSWPIALLCGGIITMVLDLIEQKTDNSGFWFTIPLSILSLFYANINMSPSLFSQPPIWAYAGIGLILVMGLMRPKKLQHFANLALMNELDKNSYLARLERLAAQKLAAKKAVQEELSYAVFARHIEMLRLIEEENGQLPPKLANVVQHIGEQSTDILKIMKADPRDVLPGGQFLNRYLPLIHQSIVRYSTIKSLHSQDDINEDIDEKTFIALKSMQQAFTQMRQQLAENDLDDLRVDLKVMDQLIRSQGFEIKD